MKIGEDKFRTDQIKPTAFYSSEDEKIKLNWFCYELSMGIYNELKEHLEKRLKKYKIDDKSIAGFSIYISKTIKEDILQKLSGKIERVCFSYEMVVSYFPTLDDRLVSKMLDAILKAWDEQLGFCEACPTRCISEKGAYCTVFDDGPY